MENYRIKIMKKALNFLKFEENLKKLTEWEREFVKDFAEKEEMYGDRFKVSDKQWNKLNEIYNKYKGIN